MHSSRTFRLLLAAFAAVFGTLCWMISIPQAMAAESISIGVVAPESHILGKSIFNAAELAADEINANGGIDGRQIKLHEYNTNFSAADAARAYQRAVQQDHVVAMVGVFTSEVALALMPWASRLETPLLITGAASSEIPQRIHDQPDRFKYVFHSYVNSYILAKEACLYGAYRLKNNIHPELNRAVIFSEDANWTKAVDKGYEKCLPEAGFKVVDHIRFSPDTTDFTPIFSRIKDKKANVIMAAVAHVGTKSAIQWHQQQVPALFSGINGLAGSSKFWAATNGATEGLITGTPGLSGAAMTAKTPAFYKAFTKRFNVGQPAYDAYTTYDAMLTLADALKRSGVATGDDLAKALAKTDITGVLGRIRFHGLNDKYAHEVIFSQDPKEGQSFLVFQWQQGKQVIIWPERLATGKMQVPSFVPTKSQ